MALRTVIAGSLSEARGRSGPGDRRTARQTVGSANHRCRWDVGIERSYRGSPIVSASLHQAFL
jgi:hypothetical protein